MNQSEKDAYHYFIDSYARLKDLNQPYRDKFDEYDKCYRGYRDATKYPYATNYYFNKVISIIYTILSRMMSQLYRNDDVVVVKPHKAKDIDRADIISGVLNFQLNNLNSIDGGGGSYIMMLQWLLSTMIHGKGIVRASWVKDERILPARREIVVPKMEVGPDGVPYFAGQELREITEDKLQTTYDGPYVENIPVRNFLPDPEYRSIQQMPVCGHLYTRSMNWLREMESIGEFKNIDKIGKMYGKYRGISGVGRVDSAEFDQIFKDMEDAYTFEEIESDKHTANNIDIVDMFGKYSLEGDSYDVDQKINFKGREVECVCTIANYDTVVKLEKTKYGMKPFFDIGAHINPHRYWDIGMVELVKDIQEAYNDMANLRIHNAMMKVNTMLKVQVDSDIDPASLVWKPFGIIPVEDMNEVQVLEVPDMNGQIFQEQMGFFDSVIQDMSGIYDYAKGVTPERQERVGTMHALQSVAENRIKLLLMSMNHMGLKPLLKYIMLLNTYNLPAGFEFRVTGKQGQEQFGKVFGSDLHLDYDFEAKYAALEPALAKENRIQQLMQLSQVWQQDPYVNQIEFKKAILGLIDFAAPEKYLKDPKEVQQQMQEAQMRQMQMEIGKETNKMQMAREKNDTELKKAAMYA